MRKWLAQGYAQGLARLITWITALSDPMELRAMRCEATQGGQVMVKSSDKTWPTGEENGKPLQYSCLENPKNSIKGKKIGHGKMVEGRRRRG